MRTVAYFFLILSSAVIADVSFTCAARVRDAHRKHIDNQVMILVEDWEYGAYLGISLSLCAVAWIVGAGFSPERPISRFVFPVIRGSIIGAAVVGGLFTLGIGLWHGLEGEAAANDRYEWEARWLLGSAAGAVAGAAVGAGLGAVAFFRREKLSDQRLPSELTATNLPHQQA